MTTPELTLNKIRKSPKLMGKTFQASDFLANEEKEKRIQRKLNRKPKKRAFNKADAFKAEVISRFGYEVYQLWLDDKISDQEIGRLLAAERAREKSLVVPFELLVANLVKDCIRRSKREKKPAGPKEAAKIIKSEIKIATGGA